MTDPETDPTARTLRLLELMTARRFWPGGELAERLGATERTLRRDIERLRGLGYQVGAVRGRHGGYRLLGDGTVPPLVFTADEAVLISAALTEAAESGVVGDSDLAVTALAKIESMLPSAAAVRARAVRSAASVALPRFEKVDPAVLGVLAMACRDRERLRIRYTLAESQQDVGRRVEPVRLVAHRWRWYVLAWDLEREDWRTFRIDRITRPEPTGVRFPARPVPGEDAAHFVAERIDSLQREYAATILIYAPLAEVEEHLGGYATGFSAVLTSGGVEATEWRMADARPEVLAMSLIWLIWPFEVLDSPELTEVLRACAVRFAAASPSAVG
ncbi:helix-turn-helix transcriptional regulator [Microbacterium sp.]|uniref:helix-turn-helix transcriptional regulator n=1 Tax=Microbacterium sp. TaxID=51671 RepID=UPI003C731CC9